MDTKPIRELIEAANAITESGTDSQQWNRLNDAIAAAERALADSESYLGGCTVLSCPCTCHSAQALLARMETMTHPIDKDDGCKCRVEKLASFLIEYDCKCREEALQEKIRSGKAVTKWP